MLHPNQAIVLAGCFSGEREDNAWVILPGDTSIPEPSPQYRSTAEEADNRTWRHATQCSGNKVLIYSPDTDVYNIGLALLHGTPKEYAIQLNVPHATEQKYLFLNNLVTAFYNDPDLASLPGTKRELIMQTLFVCTGCDFISYFKAVGKALFFKAFFQYAQFISGSKMPGLLYDTETHNRLSGFLSFIRLVGTVYFKKHLASFNSLYGHETPVHSYNATSPSLSPIDRHKVWIHNISIVIANRIKSEEERIPTYTSLWRHWLRTCWVTNLWKHSPSPEPYDSLPPPEQCGWLKLPNCTFIIDWEDPEIQSSIENNINSLLKGCSCKSGCKTNRCGCKKKDSYCGPGCECHECNNLPLKQVEDVIDDQEEPECDSDEDGSSSSSDEEIETEIITETVDTTLFF